MSDFVLPYITMVLWGNLNNAALTNQHLPCSLKVYSEPGLVSQRVWVRIPVAAPFFFFFSLLLLYPVSGTFTHAV